MLYLRRIFRNFVPNFTKDIVKINNLIMKKTNDYLTPQADVLEMHSAQSVMTTSFNLKELQEDNSDNDFFNF